MFFGRRIRHKLPKFPPGVISAFKSMCGVVDDDRERAELMEAVQLTLDGLRRESQRNPRVDIENAEILGQCCHFLMDRYTEYSPDKRALIIGAVRYFAVADDPLDEVAFASGLYDDMRVMNYVLEKLGIEDRYFNVR
jgi:hypothetical protein